ncbi:uncharacterized protein LDX57_005705 [Aspergillus melleus]|uniref:uncharacterized protein n=1 Tax=Aspergillus melleus TaxID=138277 RepID=UPI001E8DB0AD|nr:uncharacterized protein LDX57_005705 [Aspergillus melleus]KAH8427999.1 hypothetical protein LDX57_005705 [Aspergillus melleus]
MASEMEDNYVNQYRDHVQFMGPTSRQHAAISFSQRSEKSPEASARRAAKDFIDRGFENFMSHVKTLEDGAGPLDQLLFIRHVPSTTEGQTDGDGDHAEIASIQMKETKDLFDAYGECRNTFDDDVETFPGEENRYAWFVDTSLLVASISGNIPALTVLAAGNLLFNYRRSASRRTRNLQILERLTPMMKSLEPLLKGLGIGQLDRDQSSELLQSGVLHLTALVVQCLNLILQSYLRGSKTPIRFQFLTTPIFNFVLEGVDHSSQARKVYATSQKLSCLGDMLHTEVLVFGLQKSLAQRRLDLIATPAQVVAMWGPVEFIIKGNDRLSTANEPGRKVAGGQMGVPKSGEMAIYGIRINGGIILPSGDTVDGMPKWHWMSVNQMVENHMHVIFETNNGIDIHTRIRIGGTGSLHLTPIGPARWNQSCHRSTSVEELRSRFRIPGTSDPHIKMKDFTVGLQSGEYVNVITQATFAREPGTTAKEALLSSAGLFEFQITDYDEMWGLFVSLCTGVMTRVRLRDLVAYVCLHVPGQIPELPDKSREDSLDAFVQVLSGEENIAVWLENLLRDFERRNPGSRQLLQDRILSLFRNVLAMVKDTGISREGDLRLAFLNQQYKHRMLVLHARDHPWTKVLSDSSITATFACVSPHCFETTDHTCQNLQWKLPDKFRLSTKLDMFARHVRGATDSAGTLQVGKKYCVNAHHVDMVAKVDRVVNPVGNQSFYSITAKERRVPLYVCQHILKRADLREENSPNAAKCIISGYGD